MSYNVCQLGQLHESQVRPLNPYQKKVFNSIIQLVATNVGKLFFVNGHSGTSKMFLWKTIISKLCSEMLIVLHISTLGIAVLLLPSGQTAHSRFYIPLVTKLDLI